MIRVYIGRSDKGLMLCMHGHAGYAERGSDIVCSAATILAYSLAERVRECGGKITMQPGYACIISGTEALDALETVASGYRLLAEGYPDYIEVQRGADIEPPNIDTMAL